MRSSLRRSAAAPSMPRSMSTGIPGRMVLFLKTKNELVVKFEISAVPRPAAQASQP
jgi:hypothetical protein